MILCEIDEESGERGGRAAVDEEMRLWYCHADGVWRPEEALYPSADKEEILAALQDASDARAIAEYAALAADLRELRALLADRVHAGALGPLR